MSQSWIRGTKTVLSYALMYFAADWALNRLAFSDGWTIVWPLNGVTVALLLMRPRSSWIWMLLGIEIGTGIGEFLDDNSLVSEIGQRICSATEVLVCAAVLPACSNVEEWLRTPRIHARFFAALILGPGLSGLMAAWLFHELASQPYLLAFNNWATADALGVAATLPLALTWNSPQMRLLFTPAALPEDAGNSAAGFSRLRTDFLGQPLSIDLPAVPAVVDGRLNVGLCRIIHSSGRLVLGRRFLHHPRLGTVRHGVVR